MATDSIETMIQSLYSSVNSIFNVGLGESVITPLNIVLR